MCRQTAKLRQGKKSLAQEVKLSTRTKKRRDGSIMIEIHRLKVNEIFQKVCQRRFNIVNLFLKVPEACLMNDLNRNHFCRDPTRFKAEIV